VKRKKNRKIAATCAVGVCAPRAWKRICAQIVVLKLTLTLGGIWAKYFSTHFNVEKGVHTSVQEAISHTDPFFVTYHSNVEKFKSMQDSVSSSQPQHL